MSNAISSQNTYFATSLGFGSPAGSPPDELWSELAEVVSIGGPNETSTEDEVTHLRSPGSYREFIQTFKDGGDLPMELNFVPGSLSQAALRAEFDTGSKNRRRIFYPDGTTDTFLAYVKGRGKSAAVGKHLPLNVTLRIVGPVVTDDAVSSPPPA